MSAHGPAAAAQGAYVARVVVDMSLTIVAVTIGIVAAAGLVIGLTELAHWAASGRHLGSPRWSFADPDPPLADPETGTTSQRAAAAYDGARANAAAGNADPTLDQVVLVLGYPSGRRGRLHPLQRWRTEIAVRSVRHARGWPTAPNALLVFSGAATRSAPVAEAEMMARYAREVLGVPADRIVEEIRAHTTKQNLTFAMPYLESAATIKIASDPLHAARARRYLQQLRPDLRFRLAAADDYRLLEKPHLKLVTAAYEATRPALRHVMPPLRAWHRERTRRRANRPIRRPADQSEPPAPP